ncbi:MAG: GNAT family N-acetyltransferase [Pirellulaceae bacterium]|jgi:CelD/BcsL family acetyltransferase involved in cellulose biosynthesis|nr:GNAT family N-acetyltransferase [Pirellulaceae bacterium]
MTDYDVRLVDSPDDLADLRDDWDRLLAETPRATFFQTLDWLTVYWRHHGDSQQLRVFVVQDGTRPIGILPLAVYWEKSRIGTARVLGYPLDNWGTSFGPIGPQPRETLVSALSWLRRRPRDWDVLDLRWAEGPVATATETSLQQVDLSAVRCATCELSWIDLSDGWGRYWASRTSKLRNNVRRSEKRLASDGRLDSIHCRPTATDPRWDLYQQCEQVAARSWQAAVASGNTLTDAPVQRFLRDVHRAAVDRHAASINLLTLNDEPIAFSYDYVFQNGVYGLRTGFDPAFAQAGPGAVLLARSLRDGCQHGDRTFDLGETPSAYKTKWRTRASTSSRFCHYPRLAWRAQALRWKRQLFDLEPAIADPPAGQSG